jgi:hypothetical protein
MANPKAARRRKNDSVEYSVYIFHRQAHLNDNHITWEKRHTTSNIHRAYKQAENLFNSDAYEKVEIKRKFFDARAKCRIDQTLKIFKHTPNRPVGMWSKIAAVMKAVFPGVTWRLRGLKNRLRG